MVADDLIDLEDGLAEELRELEDKFDAFTTELEPETIKPYKKDIDVCSVSLLWLPYNEDQHPVW